MIVLHYDPGNAYSRYGIDHFIQRSGIPFDTGSFEREGIITYGSGSEKTFSIRIHGTEIRNAICGRISFHHNSVPVCEIPDNTGNGEKDIAFFSGTSEKYPCVTRTADTIDVGIDIFQETGHLLSGHLDAMWGTLGEPERDFVASHPSVDLLEDLLVAAVLEGCRSLKIPLVRKSPWPDARKFAVCLTHDVDEVRKTYQWLTRPVRCLGKGDLPGLKRQLRLLYRKIRGVEPYWTFNEIAAIEKQFKAKSTFFFLKESGKPKILSPRTWNLYGRSHSYSEPGVTDAICLVSGYGSEVAVHGSFYSYADPGLIKDETDELSALIHEKISGIRQHHLNLSVPATWDYQWDAGLSYDTTLGYKDRAGFRWGTSYPFFPFTGTVSHPIREIPLTIMDIAVLSHKDPLADCLLLAKKVGQVGGVLTLLWHPPLFNSLEFPGAGEVYATIIGESIKQNAWVTSAREIAEWQSARDATRVSFRQNGPMFTIGLTDPDNNCFLSIYPPLHSVPEFSENARVIGREIDPISETECIHICVLQDEKKSGIEVNFT